MEKTLADPALLLGRILLSAIFVLGGIGKIAAYAATAQYMEAAGVPGLLLPLVILTELGGGLLILAGWQTRYAAIALAGFTIIAALIFHSKFGDRNQLTHFLKNMAMAGGFLSLFVSGAGRWSLDGRKS